MLSINGNNVEVGFSSGASNQWSVYKEYTHKEHIQRWSISAGFTVTGRRGREEGIFEFTLEDSESVDVVRIVEPHMHLDERFLALQAQHMPGFRLGQQFRDRILGQL